MRCRNNLTASRAHELLEYNPDTGELTWIVDKARAKKGSLAGSISSHGYIVTRIDGFPYKNHRLVWLLNYGYLPICDIDHINGIKIDNRLANLREAINSINNENLKKAYKCNVTGLLGVTVTDRNRYQASIRVNKKLIYLGVYKTPEDAYQIYIEAKRKFHDGNTL